jgi:hypothetical protein
MRCNYLLDIHIKTIYYCFYITILKTFGGIAMPSPLKTSFAAGQLRKKKKFPILVIIFISIAIVPIG